jgi:deazaflavin-dependent oxidoreductase (nitroreductase family)
MWYNAIMAWVLRSPLHGLLSQSTMVMTYTGRKSGKVYSTPMNYVRVREAGGDVFLTTSYRQRAWWRNLRGGAPVVLRVQGKDLKARAEVIEAETGVAEGLKRFLLSVPAWAQYYNVKLDPDGKPTASDVAEATKTRVIVRTRLA